MNRRTFLRCSTAAGLAAVGCSAPRSMRQATTENLKPNFLFIFTDDQGYGDLGVMGHPVLQTPNLDRFARSACLLDNCYVASPVCAPSRAACMTGRIPTGME